MPLMKCTSASLNGWRMPGAVIILGLGFSPVEVCASPAD
jgi:hypothetical protein